MHSPHFENFQALREMSRSIFVTRQVDRNVAKPEQVKCASFALCMRGILPVVLDRTRIIERGEILKGLLPLPFLGVEPGARVGDFLLHLGIVSLDSVQLCEHIIFLSLFGQRAWSM